MKINTLKFDFIKLRFNICKIVSYMQKFDLGAQHTIVKLAPTVRVLSPNCVKVVMKFREFFS